MLANSMTWPCSVRGWMLMLRVSTAGLFLLMSLYTPNVPIPASAKNNVAPATNAPLCLRASAISTVVEDGAPETEADPEAVVEGAAVGEFADAACLTALPDSVSRFSRFRSALISEAY